MTQGLKWAEVERHQQGEQGAAEAGQRQRQSPAALQPVQHRADERGDDGERRDRDDQVEQHPAGRLGGGGGEEQGPGQRDGQGGVDRVVGHHGVGQVGQAGLVGAVGGGGPVEHLHAAGGQFPAAQRRHPGDGELARAPDA